MNEIIADKICLFCKGILPNYISNFGVSYSYCAECEICKTIYSINYVTNICSFIDNKFAYFLVKYIIQNNRYIIRINFRKQNNIIGFEIQTDKDIILFDTFDEANKYYYKYISNLIFQ